MANRVTLRAIRRHPRLELQLVCTGMHLDPAHGRTIDTIRSEGWGVDAEIPWGNDHSPLGSSNGSYLDGRRVTQPAAPGGSR